MDIFPTLLVSHGATVYTASPGNPTHAWLSSLAPALSAARPRAIVVVSAHHLTDGAWAVTSSPHPPLLHDHPVAALHGERYSPPGDPALASELVGALNSSALPAQLDPQRGLDHGAWLPLRAMAPRAEVPVVMLSVNARASTQQHVAAGAAMAPLRSRVVVAIVTDACTAEDVLRPLLKLPPAQAPPQLALAL
jgi:4,5-DOPA dioxygenase extradiol